MENQIYLFDQKMNILQKEGSHLNLNDKVYEDTHSVY